MTKFTSASSKFLVGLGLLLCLPLIGSGQSINYYPDNNLFADGSSTAPSGAFASSRTTGFYLYPAVSADLGYAGTTPVDQFAFAVPYCDFSATPCHAATAVRTLDVTGNTDTYPSMGGFRTDLAVTGTIGSGIKPWISGNTTTLLVDATSADATAQLSTTLDFNQAQVDGGDTKLIRVGEYTATATAGTHDDVEGIIGWVQLSGTATASRMSGIGAVLEMGDETAIGQSAAALVVTGPASANAGTDNSNIYRIRADTGYGRVLFGQLRDTDYSVEATGGKGLLVSGKTNQLQLAKASGGTKPTCDATARGSVWYEPGGDGVADTTEVCRKDASNNYAWVSVY
jgi:hypothetical protein